MCMAQHDLFQIIPELEAHIQPPPFQEAVERLYKRNAWIGPAGGAAVQRNMFRSHPDAGTAHSPLQADCKLTEKCTILAGCSTPLHRDPYRNALCQVSVCVQHCTLEMWLAVHAPHIQLSCCISADQGLEAY